MDQALLPRSSGASAPWPTIRRPSALGLRLCKSESLDSTVQRKACVGACSRRSRLVPTTRKWNTPVCQVQTPLQERSLTAQRSHVAKEDFLSIPYMWQDLAQRHGDKLAVLDLHHKPTVRLTYRELERTIKSFAAGLHSHGLENGDRVALFAENSGRWTIADQGIMMNGAADAVRGSTSPIDELKYIISKAGCSGLVVDDTQILDRLVPVLSSSAVHNGAASNGVAGNGDGSNGASCHQVAHEFKFVVLLWGKPSKLAMSSLGCPVLTFEDVVEGGQPGAAAFQIAPVQKDTLATLVFTSGTTGNPKGVMLTHGNLAYQRSKFSHYVQPAPGERTLSLLPPWHIYERAVAYFLFSCACEQVYTNIRYFRDDLGKHPPHFFVCVPLVLDTLYKRVQAQIKVGSKVKRTIAQAAFRVGTAYIHARRILQGTAIQYAQQKPAFWVVAWAAFVVASLHLVYKLAKKVVFDKIRSALGVVKCMVSGGGSLSNHLDDFYEVLGLPVVNGWGLSETSPVLSCRRNLPGQNIRGTVGFPIPDTQLRVVDPDTLADIPDGQLGLILARGPGVMAGYYGDESATAKAFRAGSGWLDTGDLGWRAPSVRRSAMAGCISLSGRAKDTIVLSSGENVEPGPIEDAISASRFVAHAIVWGQDHRMLGALIVPDKDAFEELQGVRGELSEKEIRDVVRSEIAAAVKDRSQWEQIAAFVLLKEPLSVDDGTLTRTMKPKRPAIFSKYATEIAQLQAALR